MRKIGFRARSADDAGVGFWKGTLFSAVIAVGFLITVESVLWVAGVETVIEREDPLRGFSGLVPVFERDGDVYRTKRFGASNPFNEQSFLAAKPDNGLRIFTLGGSSAYGHPWGGHVAFTAIVGEAIAAAHPQLAVEAVNVAGVSYAIHRLGIVADEILSFEPDIVIVYSGHNEFAEPTFFRELKRRSPQRNRLELLASSMRFYSLMRGLLLRPHQEISPEARFDMFVRRNESLAYSSTQKAEITEAFRLGLRRIVRHTHERGGKVVLATVPANLSRWSPNHSIIDSSLDENRRSRWAAALAAGKQRLATGAFDEAAEYFNRALEIAPHHAESHYLLAQTYEGMEQWDGSRRHYELACDYDASPIRRTSAINDAIEAVATEEDALLVDVDSIFEERSKNGLIGFELIDDYVHPTQEGHRIIAWHLWNRVEDAGWLGRPIESRRRIFDRVVSDRETDSKSPQPAWLYNQGYMLAHQGQTQLAIAKFRAALAVAPTFEPVMSNLAQLLADEGEDEQAMRILEQLFRQYPENVHGRVTHGMILARRGHDEEALAEFRRAIRTSPDVALAHLHLGALLLKNQDLNAAKSAFARAIAIDPNNVDAKLGMARVLESSGDRATAVEQYRAVIDAHPSSSVAHYELGLLLSSQRQIDEGVRLLEIAAALAPESAEIPLAIGVYQLRTGEYEESARHFQMVLSIDPESVAAHNYLGRVMQSTGELQKAAHYYREALRIDPGYAEAYVNLGRAMEQSGRSDLAIEHYRRAIQLRSNWPVPHNNLAWILATDPDPRLRDPAEAVALATKAVQLMDRRNPSSLDTLAAAQAAANRFDQAEATARRALELALENGAEEQANDIRQRMLQYTRGEPYRTARQPDRR